MAGGLAYVLAEDLACEGGEVSRAAAHVEEGEALAQLEGLERGAVDGRRREMLDAVAEGHVDVAHLLALALWRVDEVASVHLSEGLHHWILAD